MICSFSTLTITDVTAEQARNDALKAASADVEIIKAKAAKTLVLMKPKFLEAHLMSLWLTPEMSGAIKQKDCR